MSSRRKFIVCVEPLILFKSHDMEYPDTFHFGEWAHIALILECCNISFEISHICDFFHILSSHVLSPPPQNWSGQGTEWIGVGHVVNSALWVMCPLPPTATASHSTQDPVSQSEAVATPEIAHTGFPGGSSAANSECEHQPGLIATPSCRWACYLSEVP